MLNSSGHLLATLSESDINGPWDMTVFEKGQGRVLMFVTNALSGTVTRFEAQAASGGLTIMTHTQIASGYMHRCDAAALVVGPTGLVNDPRPPREKRRLDRGSATHNDRLPAAGAPRT